MVFLLNIEQTIEENRNHFFSWRHERDHEDVKTDQMDIEEYFASVMYGDLVDLHRRFNSTDEEIALYVRGMNELIQEILNDLI